MNNKKYEEVVNTMLEIKQKLSEGLEQNNKELVGIEYYKSFQIKGNRMNLIIMTAAQIVHFSH